MGSDSWIGRFLSRLRAGVVEDVPPSLEECESCREVDCTQERWLTCERRLAAEAASLGASGGVVASTGITDELPSQAAAPAPPAEAEQGEMPEAGGRRRTISSH
jgi:hypothetical protein